MPNVTTSLCKLVFLAVAIVLTPAKQSVAASLSGQLLSDVIVNGKSIRVKDIVQMDEIESPGVVEMNEIVIASAPMPGRVLKLAKEDVAAAIRHRAGGTVDVALRGRERVDVRVATQRIDGDDVVAVAAGQLLYELRPRLPNVSVYAVRNAVAMEIPLGGFKLQARPATSRPVFARTPVWVDVFLDGVAYKSVVVEMVVNAGQEVWRARKELSAGVVIRGADFELETSTQFVAGALTTVPSGVRLKKQVQAGQVLCEGQIADEGSVLRGDAVTVQIKNSNMEIRLVGRAEQDGGKGQLIDVRPEQGASRFRARVLGDGIVEAEFKQ